MVYDMRDTPKMQGCILLLLLSHVPKYWGLAPYPRALPYIKVQLCNSKGAFTLGIRDSKVESPYTMLAI